MAAAATVGVVAERASAVLVWVVLLVRREQSEVGETAVGTAAGLLGELRGRAAMVPRQV